LDLPYLKRLDLSGNEIVALEGLEKLDSIQYLNLAKNMISDLDYLMVLKFNSLQEIDFGFNRIQMSYLDHLFEILKDIKSLRKVTFSGNEMCFNKLYKMKICMLSNLTHLDTLEIRPYARRAL
jgi:Leucine Rich repeat